MSTQQKHTAIPGLDIGAWIAWTDYNGEEQIDEVRALGSKRITTALTHVAYNAENLRVVPKPEPPATDATSHQPKDGETRSLPLRRIAPSPLNPRKTFHRDTLEGLAESIRDTGLIQSLVVRPTDDWQVVPCRRSGVEGWSVQHLGFPSGHWDIQEEYGPHWFRTHEEAEAHRPQWELIAGERRFRASLLAGKADVECKLRIGLDDAAAYRMMIDENEEREPVNPIDEALSLHVMLVRGVSQRRLAEVLGNKSQTKISRMAALVELPESVKQLGRERKLQASHLERLAKWKAHPELCAAIAEISAEKGASVRDLEAKLPHGEELEARKLVKLCQRWGVDFDLDQEREAHPAAFVPGPYDGYFYCLDMQLYARLQRDGKKAKREAQQREAAAALEKAGLPADADLPNVNTLRNAVRFDFETYRTPSCDCKTCPCAGQAWDPHATKVVPVCTDPARLRQLREEDEAKAREIRAAAAEDAFEQVLTHVRDTSEISGRDLLYLATLWLTELSQAAALLGLDLPDLRQQDRARRALLAFTPLELRNLLVLSAAIHERDSRIRWAGTQQMEWYLGIEAPPAPAPTADAAGEDWPCQSCGELVTAETVAALDEALGERPYLANAEGVILTAKSGIYCTECAPDTRICRVCGCTEELGCDEGCTWEDDDTCTACAEKLRRAPGEVTVACYDCATGLDPRDGLLSVTRAGRLAHVCDGCKGEELAAAGGVA